MHPDKGVWHAVAPRGAAWPRRRMHAWHGALKGCSHSAPRATVTCTEAQHGHWVNGSHLPCHRACALSQPLPRLVLPKTASMHVYHRCHKKPLEQVQSTHSKQCKERIM